MDVLSLYETATNETVPAIRSCIAKELVNKYRLSEDRVARLLGVAQPAISKYMNGRYSERVKGIETMINKELVDRYIKEIIEGRKKRVDACVCAICQSINSFNCVFSSANGSEL
jgi:predicted transcriptional regulator